MSWRAVLDTLLGRPAPALPDLPGRVHLIADEMPTDPEELQRMGPAEVAAHVGCSRQAAQFRIRRAQASGDWSGLLAPAKTSSSSTTAASTAAQRKEATNMATTTTEQARSAGIKDVRRTGARIMAAALKANQPKVGLALLGAGCDAEAAFDVLGARAGPGDTFCEMVVGATLTGEAQDDAMPTFASQEAAVAAMLAASRKAGL